MSTRSLGRADTRIRIFVAAYPPSSIVDALLRAAASLDLPPHRVTPADRVHLTLQFVGDVERRDLDSVIESTERATRGIGRFEVVPDRLISLPERGPARLVAAWAPSLSPLDELTSRLASRLAREPRKKGRFTPHWTLLRFRSPVSGWSVDRPIESTPIFVERIAVMQSHLRPGGAEHRVIEEIPLG